MIKATSSWRENVFEGQLVDENSKLMLRKGFGENIH